MRKRGLGIIIISVFIIMMIGITMILLADTESIEAEKETLRDAQAGDIVSFGNYESNTQWLVLERKEDSLLLLSKNLLDKRQYNSSSGGITWEDCDIRQWLNEEYYENTFTLAEKLLIEKTELSSGEDEVVSDKVFLLSIDEVREYFPVAETRDACYQDGNQGWWWTRMPLVPLRNASYVDYGGYMYYAGGHCIDGRGGVRPAVWINLSK